MINRAPTRNRFTLIELLVVVTIIAMLAALLLPALAKARYIAKNSLCISNQKQIAMVWLNYASENDELYPDLWPAFTSSTSWTGSRDAKARIHQYYLYFDKKDLRPTLRDYSDPNLGSFMICPLAVPMWFQGKGRYNINYNTDRPRSAYMLYNTGNRGNKHFPLNKTMIKVGHTWSGGSGTAKNVEFNILASDLLKIDTYGRPARMLVSTQSAISGDQYIGGQWINGPNGWELYPHASTYANFALDDGSVHTVPNVSQYMEKSRIMLMSGTYYLPAELAQ